MGRGGVPVALYVPNLIGYFRIISGLASFYYAFSSPLLFFFTYGLSQMLDAVDGVAARALGQSECAAAGADGHRVCSAFI